MTSSAAKTRIAVASLHALYDTRITNHLKTLLGEGFDVVYVNWSKSTADLSAELDSIRLVRRRADEMFGINLVRFAAMLAWFFFQLVRLRPRLIHLHDVVLLPIVPLLKLTGSGRVVFDAHEHYCQLPGVVGLFSRLSYRLFLPLVDGIVAVSPSTIPPTKRPSVIVPNYQRRSDFEPYRSPGERNGHVDVVYFGDLSPGFRDVALLLDAAEVVLERTKYARVKYGGRLHGPGAAAFRPRFESLAREYPERFFWFCEMPREAVLRETANADVGLLLTSATNTNLPGSSPNKIFEYFAAGTALIATDGFLVAAEVRDAAAGLLFPPGTSADEIAPQLLDLLADPRRLKEMKRASWELGNRYRWEEVEGRFLDLYRHLGVSAA